MESRVDTITLENGERQRFETVSGFEWDTIDFVYPKLNQSSFESFVDVYRKVILKRNIDTYGLIVLFHVPDSLQLPFSPETEFGYIFDRQVITYIQFEKLLKEGLIQRNGNTIVSYDSKTDKLITDLKKAGFFSLLCGNNPDSTVFIPVSSKLGHPSSFASPFNLICNSHFFLMTPKDRDSVYDVFGTPFGMIIKNGKMYSPPLFGREALFVGKDGIPCISKPDLRKIVVKIQNKDFIDSENCRFYFRPENYITPGSGGTDIVISGNKVIAINKGGQTRIPMSGFVINTEESVLEIQSYVEYLGFDNIKFGIQTGSSAVVDNKVPQNFMSPFFDEQKFSVPFPPVIYPLDYSKDCAARIAVGSNAKGKPVLVWAEGNCFTSCGVSLLDLGRYCKSIGIVNAVNLDGGGSAQFIVQQKRHLTVSARLSSGNDNERPVPVILSIKN